MSDSDSDDSGDIHIAADTRDVYAQRSIAQFETYKIPVKGSVEIGKQLHALVLGGDAQQVESFIQEQTGNPDFNVSWSDPKNHDNTALHLAAEMEHLAVAQVLVSSGCDVNAQNAFALTPIALTSPESNRPLFEFFSEQETGKLFAQRARAMEKRRFA